MVARMNLVVCDAPPSGACVIRRSYTFVSVVALME
jgi:hypothetical protein